MDIDTPKTPDRSPDTATGYPRSDTGILDRSLRFVPPVAALGTAFVLQVVLITDIGGGVLVDRMADTGPAWLWYALAGLFGLSVASCLEGGAAYLMDLYDRHLLARDSVWLLRLGMVGYVGVSALMVHWWAGHRGLPELVAWVLAGMSASALFLWSRWAQRREMVPAGQLDPALPRMPLAAKLLHPIRWLVTLYLISWEPVTTVDEADARQEPDFSLAPVRNINSRTPRKGGRRRAAEVSDDELARELDRSFPDRVPGVPTAMPHLRNRFGSCSRQRATAAVRKPSGWRNGGQSDDDDEGSVRRREGAHGGGALARAPRAAAAGEAGGSGPSGWSGAAGWAVAAGAGARVGRVPAWSLGREQPW